MKDMKIWLDTEADDALTCLLMTSSDICKDKEELSASELDNLKDIWATIKNIHKVRHHMGHIGPINAESMTMHHAVHTATPAARV